MRFAAACAIYGSIERGCAIPSFTPNYLLLVQAKQPWWSCDETIKSMTKKRLFVQVVGFLIVALLAFQLLRHSVHPVRSVSTALLVSNNSPAATSGNTAKGQAPRSGQLSAALLASIQAELPGYSLPDASAGHHPFTDSCETPASSPFYSVGDFTGRGHQEFALILTGPEGLRFVVFGPDATGKLILLHSARPKTAEEWGKHWDESLIERPEQIDLCRVPQGEPWAPEAGDSIEELRPATDAVAIHTHPHPNDDMQSLILYKDGAFQQTFFEPLVRLR